MDEELRKNLTAADTWVRGVFMVLFAIVYGVAIGVLFLVIPFQFCHTLFVGKPSDPLLDFSENLCAYVYEILLYVSFNSDERPFPFAPWPSERTGYAEEPVIVANEQTKDPVEGTDQKGDDEPEVVDLPPQAPSENVEPKGDDKE